VVMAGYVSRGFSVALGTASGEFQPGTFLQIGSGADFKPRSVVISDLDQDGIKDIVTTGQQVNGGVTTGFASWLKGNGDGSFQNAISINQILNSCTDPRALSSVDIDLDGRPELAILCYTSQNIWISRRHTDGTWKLQTNGTSINNGAGTNGTSMTFGRLTTAGSTGLDLAVSGLDTTNSMRLINNIDINVTSPSTGGFLVSGSSSNFYTMHGFPADVKIADLNADGLGDVIVTMQRQSAGNVTGGAYYTCLSSAAGVCNPIGWGMEGVGASSISVGELGTDDTPEFIIGYRGIGRLIFRTLAKITNLSQ